MSLKTHSARRPILTFAVFAASLMLFAGHAAAANCPQGATCKCTTTILTDCTVGPDGKQTCTQSTVLDCTVVSGPGSGKATLVQPTGPVTQSPRQVSTLSVSSPKSFVFTR